MVSVTCLGIGINLGGFLLVLVEDSGKWDMSFLH